MELYKKYRPSSFKRIVGNQKTVNQLTSMIEKKKLPHTILFFGPSGCGKTTLARIVRKELNCSDHDFAEVNCADFRGIDMVRDIRNRMNLAPVGGSVRVWLIDECHKLSNDAQNAFLKILEDTPAHVYFFLCTTEPQKLLSTIRSRASTMPVEALKTKETEALLNYVLKKEQKEINIDVLSSIAEAAEGGSRKALVLLDQVLSLENEDEQLECIKSAEMNRQAIEIARALMNPKTNWKTMSAILRGVDEDPESLRYMILGYCTAILLKTANKRAAFIIDEFRDNYFDAKKAGLVADCFSVIFGE